MKPIRYEHSSEPSHIFERIPRDDSEQTVANSEVEYRSEDESTMETTLPSDRLSEEVTTTTAPRPVLSPGDIQVEDQVQGMTAQSA